MGTKAALCESGRQRAVMEGQPRRALGGLLGRGTMSDSSWEERAVPLCAVVCCSLLIGLTMLSALQKIKKKKKRKKKLHLWLFK